MKKTYVPSSICFPFFIIGGIMTVGGGIACIIILLSLLGDVDILTIEKLQNLIPNLLFAMLIPATYMLVLYLVDEKIIKKRQIICSRCKKNEVDIEESYSLLICNDCFDEGVERELNDAVERLLVQGDYMTDDVQ